MGTRSGPEITFLGVAGVAGALAGAAKWFLCPPATTFRVRQRALGRGDGAFQDFSGHSRRCGRDRMPPGAQKGRPKNFFRRRFP